MQIARDECNVVDSSSSTEELQIALLPHPLNPSELIQEIEDPFSHLTVLVPPKHLLLRLAYALKEHMVAPDDAWRALTRGVLQGRITAKDFIEQETSSQYDPIQLETNIV